MVHTRCEAERMRAAQTDANVEARIDGGRPREAEPIGARADRGRHRPRMCRGLQICASVPIIDDGVEPDVTGNAA